ncbi:protein DEHYDRATION-INDUCED 19 homolog 6-like [Aristolochia californica]|uniref:protein DEHYDRATION-INDUCED 19 homolog 6-like n=1 Tax=Aristolochia californica TaxID=171875 RepID=UPI0035DEADA8
MDVEFWTSMVNSAKHISVMQATRLNSETYLCLDDSEGDDDLQSCFPCPFCYGDIEVPLLCTHLQEEHCFDVKNAVCPVCAANLGKDMIEHFTVQHSHLLKRRRKLQRTGLWTNSGVSKELQELSSFIGITASNRRNTTDDAPDPLLSPFLCGLVLPDVKSNQEACLEDDKVALIASDSKSSGQSVPDAVPEQADEEARERAAFVQQLLLATIF